MLTFLLFSSITINSEPLPSEELFLPLPEGWFIVDGADQYPLLITHQQSRASLLVLRSVLEKDEVIRNADELKPSVDMVAGDIIGQLPEAEVVSNSGYFEENRVRFVLEFNAVDTLDNSPWFHRLSGFIYTIPDGTQLIFTLWGRLPLIEEGRKEGIKLIQSSFSYNGPQKQNVFDFSESTTTGRPLIYGGVAFIVLLTILFIRRNRARITARVNNDDSNFWSCSCGRLNHGEITNCRRCGRPKD